MGPPLPPGPEVGGGWGVTRGDSLSHLPIREGAAGCGFRACPPCASAPGAPRAPGLGGRGDWKAEEEEPEEGLPNRPPAPNLPGKLVRREGQGPGPRREEGRPQLHPAPLASFPALLCLLLLFLLYESGVSRGFGAATRGPGARSCSRRRARSSSAGVATAAGTRVPGAREPWRGRPRAQTAAGAATAAAAAAAAPPRPAPRPPAP